jgi:ubiquinone biosynthesis protein UbiJ
MAGVLFLLIVFGGGMLLLLSKTEIGRAIADRIRGERLLLPGTPSAVADEIDRLRTEVSELHERLEFTERMLARREPDQVQGR